MNITYYKKLPSTNDEAKKEAYHGAAAFFSVQAESQSAGRGRIGRKFYSPKGGTYFSVVLRPRLPVSSYGLITPFAALSVYRAVKKLTGIELGIKWINDLLLNGKKVCGILCESGTDQCGNPFVIVGIGINTGKWKIPREIADIAAVLPFSDAKSMAEAVITELKRGEKEIETGSFLAEYAANCVHLGKTVSVIKGEEKRTATALSIADNGGLFVRYENGEEEVLTGGEISIRPTPNISF